MSIHFTAASLVLTIKDDGIGFDTIVRREGIGISNIKNRAELHNGRIQIILSAGKGCSIKVEIPL